MENLWLKSKPILIQTNKQYINIIISGVYKCIESLAQLEIGLKLILDYMGAWRMLMVPGWRLEGWGHL